MPRTIKTYEQALEFLHGRTNYERFRADGYTDQDFKLDRMQKLLSLAGDPQDRIPCIHIAGTKGKGSTATMIAQILAAGGYRTGLFTSPHIYTFEERMMVNGVSPNKTQFLDLICRLVEPVNKLDNLPGNYSPTFFEIATALSWLYFEQSQTQLAVMEVGMGGRLDSTNICNPLMTIVTNISRDHTQFLGETLPEIAREKAGIIKPQIPVISGVLQPEAQHVIQNRSHENRARLYQLNHDMTFRYTPPNSPKPSLRGGSVPAATSHVEIHTPWNKYPSIPVPLAGEHQAANAALAVTAIDLLARQGWAISPQSIKDGMSAVRCPLRIETLGVNPTLLVDAAHNEASAEALAKSLTEFPRSGQRTLVFSGTSGKDINSILQHLLPHFDQVLLTQYRNNPRAVPVEELEPLVRSISRVPVHIFATPSTAWNFATETAKPDDLICATGSFFIAAEIRELILSKTPDTFRNISIEDAAVAR